MAGSAGGAIGKAIGGNIGKAIGSIVGGLAGGLVGGIASKGITDIFKEDDIQIFSRIFSAYLTSLTIDYMLSDYEVGLLSKEIRMIDDKVFEELNFKYRNSRNQEKVIIDFLTPIFEKIVYFRPRLMLPNDEEIINGFLSIAQGI